MTTFALSDYPILCVDDEEANLVTLKYAFEERFRILTAKSGGEALDILARTPAAILLCDQRMPGMSGVELCTRARALRPETVRMLITAYTDVESAIAAINLGQVTRFLLKPWRVEELEQVLRSALEIVHLKRTVRDVEKHVISALPQRITLVANAAVVHELSNPLAAMTMALAEASETGARLLGVVQTQSHQALAEDLKWLCELHDELATGLVQVNAMLSRMREGAKADEITGHCDLQLAVESCVRLLRRQIETHTRLEVACEPSIGVGLNPSVVAEVVINLILNASRWMDAAGLRDRTIRVEGRHAGANAVLTIADDGEGVVPADVERLVDGRQGSLVDSRKLGLVIAHDLVQRAGGSIKVERIMGRGTRFDVTLPCALESALDATL